jgi:tetratricopeptide (TPR) repeat protein
MKKQAFLTFVTALMAVGQDAWTERMSLANRLQQQGHYSEARELYQKAVAETDGNHGNTQRRAQALNNLAAHYFEVGKYTEAEPMYRKAIEQWRGLGQAGQLGITYSNLATLYRKTGRYKLAIETFAEAERPIREAFGPQSPEMVSYLVNLTEAYRASNRLDDAESSAATALALSEKIFPNNDVRVSLCLQAYALVLHGRGRTSQATPLLERALTIQEASYESDHPNIASTSTSLVSLYLEEGRYDQAEKHEDRALKIWASKLGPQHPNIAAALNNLAQVYRFQQRYAEAEPLYRRSIEILENLHSPEAVKPLSNLADLYKDRGRTAAALALYKRCEQITRASFGDATPQTAAIDTRMATLYRAMGRNTEAAQVYKRVRQDRQAQAFQPAP